MQERRMTVRAAYSCRAQYCAAEDLLPHDGRLANVSERGANLLAREGRKEGEQVTVSFALPASADALTATGVVQWSLPAKGRWHAVGLEWLPLEEGYRNRLHEFLYTQPSSATAAAPAAPPGRPIRISWVAWAVAFLLLVALGAAAFWMSSLRRHAQQLEFGIQQRSIVIDVLKEREERLSQRESWLRQELVTTKTHLAAASGEMARLDAQAQSLGADALRLRQEVDLFQRSYDKTQQERAQLIQEVMNLEQERLKLLGKLSSLPQLQIAIREAIDARRQQKRAEWIARARFSLAPNTDRGLSPGDNQGYIIRNGQPTQQRHGGALSIRVLEPQSSK